jgi:hypothetical protein
MRLTIVILLGFSCRLYASQTQTVSKITLIIHMEGEGLCLMGHFNHTEKSGANFYFPFATPVKIF